MDSKVQVDASDAQDPGAFVKVGSFWRLASVFIIWWGLVAVAVAALPRGEWHIEAGLSGLGLMLAYLWFLSYTVYGSIQTVLGGKSAPRLWRAVGAGGVKLVLISLALLYMMHELNMSALELFLGALFGLVSGCVILWKLLGVPR